MGRFGLRRWWSWRILSGAWSCSLRCGGTAMGDLIPERVFIVASRIGGQVIGAFDGRDGDRVCDVPAGVRDGRAYLHSHMLAVLPEYRNAGLGRRLKLAQRDGGAGARDRPDGVDVRSTGDQECAPEHCAAGCDCAAVPAGFLRAVDFSAAGRTADGSAVRGVVAALGAGAAAFWGRAGRRRRTSAPVVEQVDVPAQVYEWKRDPEQRKLAEVLQNNVRRALQSAFARRAGGQGYGGAAEGDGSFLLSQGRARGCRTGNRAARQATYEGRRIYADD